MLMGSRQKLRNHDLFVTVRGKQLSRVSSVRYLGLHIDENLSWNQHSADVVQRVYSRILCLNCLHPLPVDLLVWLYHVFVLPILDYCDVVWTPITERRRFHAAVQVYKVLHKLSPSYLNGTFNYAIDITLCTGWNIYSLFRGYGLL